MPTDSKLEWASPARIDLLDIWGHVAREASPPVADVLVGKIVRACARLENWPLSGRTRSEILPGARSIAVGQYVVFYRPDPDVRILRVVHGRRDFSRTVSGDG
jgi:toxin ParE1/3/4